MNPKQPHPSSFLLHTSSFDVWTSAIRAKSSAGRGGGKKQEFYGIKKLRELILELAVRGLLVPQDPEDEPASELLRRIEKEKIQLIKEGKIKGTKKPSLIVDDNSPYAVPSGWVWTSVGVIGNIFNGNSISARVKEEKYTGVDGYPFIATKDVGYGFEALDYENGIAIPHDTAGLQIARNGAVLICSEGGSAGRKCGISYRDICFGNKLFANELYDEVFPRFVLSVYLSSTFYSAFSESMTGIIGGISKSKFEALPFPLPPLAEQHRIVAKVDELMALCDQLEQQQEDSAHTHVTLVQTLLAALTAASERDQLEQAWQQIESHFDLLFTTESSIDQLKQTILQLAVMGKLVKQEIDSPQAVSLGDILLEPSFNGISKGPTTDTTATEVLRISAGTSRDDFFVDESDYKHVDIAPKDVENATLRAGDLLACRYNGNLHYVGRFSLYRAESGRPQVNPDKLIRFRVDPAVHSPRYICFAMNASSTRAVLEAMCATTAGNIGLSAGKIKTVTIPVPPLAVQHRIVAKVDELMTLCDRLKTNHQSAQTTQIHLAGSLADHQHHHTSPHARHDQ